MNECHMYGEQGEQVAIATVVQDAAAFRAWLAGLAPDAAVGVACKADACPVATWLHSCYGDDCFIEVSPHWVMACLDGSAWVRLVAPAWLRAFVRVVDGGHENYGVIAAATALEVFDTVVSLSVPVRVEGGC